MPKAISAKEIKAMKAELKRLNAFIKTHEAPKAEGFEMTENSVNTEKYGERYVFIKLAKENTELRKKLKSIRYGASGRGKARWMKDLGLWSIKAEALKGTVFGS